MKKCELCNSIARMYCESDQASLCWECDARVHAANFLVAKHSRTLLCHSCQSPTPWTGSGPRLGPTISVCHTCANNNTTDHDYGHNHNHENVDDDDGDDDTEEDDDDEDEDEGENQVVPLSSSSMNTRPVISNSSTSSEDSSGRVFSGREVGYSKSGTGFSWSGLH